MDRIQETGTTGDSIILQQASTIYALTLSENPTSFFIAKAPNTLLNRTQYSSWLDWLNHGADGALETVTTNVADLQTQFPELFVVLTLSWEKIPSDQRKKRGPPPLEGEMDFRPDWNPKIVVNGTIIKDCVSVAYDTHWPKDGSDASEKRLIAYFPINEKAISWFPYWIEFPGLKSALFVIDSKKDLTISKQSKFEE